MDPRLTADCEAKYTIPAGAPITIDVVLQRLAAVEDALFLCRQQLFEQRQADDAQEDGNHHGKSRENPH